MHAGEELDVVAEDAGKLAGRRLAGLAVLVGQVVQRGFDAALFVAYGEFQTRDGFVEQPVPGGGADGGLVVEKFFQLV